ncbi:hypothetical protein BT96DRAFT_1012080 [Gymnopus androsaceus JB14]|uniref:Bromo domain-containing protein n=1 Tax=Gymnopus androsaceus JB14 TaxID=1447944 RepID=A0A6A4IE67_9AGAR|nr:hypothetical protein BT96DRAFT_1012080 [Gymnopus androsaceus JB14]
MGGRATRRTQPEPDFSSLTNLDCLVLSQTVYQLGTSSWTKISSLLSKHPLLSHPKSFFTAQSCQAMYKHLRKEASLEITEADAEKHAPLNLELAQTHYQARILELQDLIRVEEQNFKKLVSEIEDLRDDAAKAQQVAKEDSISDLSSTSSPGKIESGPSPIEVSAASPTDALEEETPAIVSEAPSPQMIEKDLLKPEPEDEEAPMTEIDHEEEIQQVESPIGQPTPAEPMDENTPQITSAAQSPLHLPIDLGAEDEASRSSQAATPYESTAEERMDVADEEGATSGDEPLLKARTAKALKRQRKASTPQARTRRRLRRTSVLAESAPESVEPMVEDDKGQTPAQTPGAVEDEASPAPEPTSSKRQGKRRASFTELDTRDSTRMRADSEPVDDEEGSGVPSSSRRRRTENQASKRFQNVIGMLHSQISQHRNGTIFHNPIKKSEAPDYRDIVKRPMDLKTIKSKIKDGVISNSLEFQRDIYLMFANAMMYNRPGSDVYNMTEDMMLECDGYIETFRQSEGFVRSSQR